MAKLSIVFDVSQRFFVRHLFVFWDMIFLYPKKFATLLTKVG